MMTAEAEAISSVHSFLGHQQLCLHGDDEPAGHLIRANFSQDTSNFVFTVMISPQAISSVQLFLRHQQLCLHGDDDRGGRLIRALFLRTPALIRACFLRTPTTLSPR